MGRGRETSPSEWVHHHTHAPQFEGGVYIYVINKKEVYGIIYSTSPLKCTWDAGDCNITISSETSM